MPYTKFFPYHRGAGVSEYGRWEVRSKLMDGKGAGSGLWMMSVDKNTEEMLRWPDGGEIDILEHRGANLDYFFSSYHGKKRNGENGGDIRTDFSYKQLSGASSRTFVDEFHVWALEHDPKEIRWFIDGILIATLSSKNKADAALPPPGNFYWILGNGIVLDDKHSSNNPPLGGPFVSQPLVIDYVKTFNACETSEDFCVPGYDYVSTPGKESCVSKEDPSSEKAPLCLKFTTSLRNTGTLLTGMKGRPKSLKFSRILFEAEREVR